MAGGVAIALIALNRFKVTWLSLYLLHGVALWLCALKSGVHATLAGVVLAHNHSPATFARLSR